MTSPQFTSCMVWILHFILSNWKKSTLLDTVDRFEATFPVGWGLLLAPAFIHYSLYILWLVTPVFILTAFYLCYHTFWLSSRKLVSYATSWNKIHTTFLGGKNVCAYVRASMHIGTFPYLQCTHTIRIPVMKFWSFLVKTPINMCRKCVFCARSYFRVHTRINLGAVSTVRLNWQ